jgi:hypothetical protein
MAVFILKNTHFFVFFKDFIAKKVKKIAHFLDSKLAQYQTFSYIYTIKSADTGQFETIQF